MLAVGSGHALEERIVLGRTDAWQAISREGGIRYQTGHGGFLDIVLADAQVEADATTNLLLHFDKAPFHDATHHYTVLASPQLTIDRHAVFGAAAGVFQAESQALELAPERGALFYPGTVWSDFTLEFWLYPARLTDGEIVLDWNGSRTAKEQLIRQTVRCTVRERALAFVFENFFVPPDLEPFRLELTGRTGLVPRQWRHHLVRFDATTGLIEYVIDGVPEAVAYATASGREAGDVFVPQVGATSPRRLVVGDTFIGMLDELMVSTAFRTEPPPKRYNRVTGIAETRILDLGYTNTRLVRVDAEYRTPLDSDIFFSYRIADERVRMDHLEGDWIPFTPGTPFGPGVRGRFVQLRFEFYPDGSRTRSPELSQVTLAYEPDLPPPPPAGVSAEPDDGAVTVSWQKVAGVDVAGYRVYFGETSARYFGSSTTQGDSPIDAGDVSSLTIEGLDNGTLYYFAVAAYDHTDPPHESGFSREVSARPSRMFR
jgi:hypothetical protein